MASVSLTDYSSQQADIARRQKLADMLSEQGQQDIPIQSYNGVQAAIPWTALLAKALDSGVGAYQAKKASEASDALQAKQKTDFANAATEYFGGSSAPSGPTMFPTPAGATPAPPVATPPVPPMTAAALSAPVPDQGPAPSGPTPQAMGAALSASAPPGSQVTPPMPQPDSQPPPAALAPMAAAPPPQAPAPVAPSAPAAVAPPSLDDRAAAAKGKLQKALAIQTQFGAPAAAPFLKDAQEEMAKVQDAQTKAAAEEAERQRDRADASNLIGQLPIPPDAKALLTPVAAIGGMKSIAPALEQLQKNTLGPHEQYLPPDQVVKMGFNPGSIVKLNDVTHDMSVVFDPTPTKQANARIALEKQSVGIAGAHLALDQQQFAFNKDQKTNAILEPQTVSAMAGQLLAGDPSPMQNLGRGTQGAANMVAVRNEMYRQAAARGMSPEQIAGMNAKFFGQKAEARAAGTRVGATDVATSEVPGLAQEALAAHAAIPQTNLVPLNRAVQLVAAGTSSPELARAVVANQAVVNAYARSFGTGAPSDHARKEAAAILQNAWGTPAYAAALTQIQRNTQVERHGAKAALDNMGTNAPAPMPTPPGASETKVIGGVPYHKINGQWVGP